MRKQIDDILLIKKLGEGSFGEVYLAQKKGRNEFLAAKQIDRIIADQPEAKKYLMNEITNLKKLNHPNIVKYIDTKMTNNYYYIIMEYVNGYDLTKCLNKYMKKYGQAFPEEIVQYFMRQIVSAVKHMHNNNIIHRDLSFNNIMIHFDNENDKNNFNLMKGKVKIIDLGLSTVVTKDMHYSQAGTPIFMDPVLLKKQCKYKNSNLIGYNQEVDVWSLGTVCYQMIVGHPTFDSKSLDELMKKIENGTYTVPTHLSKEIVSFLNSMLQYDPKNRLNINDLNNHPFLVKSLNQFTKIDLNKVNKKIVNNQLNINTKQNRTIWSIFNKEDEIKLLSIGGKNNFIQNERPINEESIGGHKIIKSYNDIIRKANTTVEKNNNTLPTFIKNNYFQKGKNFYGKSMFLNDDDNEKRNESIKGNENLFNQNINNINFPTFDFPQINQNNQNNFYMKSNTFPSTNYNDNKYKNTYISDSNINSEKNYYRPEDGLNKDDGACCCIQ